MRKLAWIPTVVAVLACTRQVVPAGPAPDAAGLEGDGNSAWANNTPIVFPPGTGRREDADFACGGEHDVPDPATDPCDPDAPGAWRFATEGARPPVRAARVRRERAPRRRVSPHARNVSLLAPPCRSLTNPNASPFGPHAPRGTILVVEDEVLLRRVVERILAVAGYHTLPVNGGACALATLAEHGGSLSAVYLDLLLPDMPGEAVLDRLRAHYPDLPVVLTSGCDPPAGTVVGLGATAFLPKPFSAQDLYDALARAVASAGAPGRSAAPQFARTVPAPRGSDTPRARYG